MKRLELAVSLVGLVAACGGSSNGDAGNLFLNGAGFDGNYGSGACSYGVDLAGAVLTTTGCVPFMDGGDPSCSAPFCAGPADSSPAREAADPAGCLCSDGTEAAGTNHYDIQQQRALNLAGAGLFAACKTKVKDRCTSAFLLPDGGSDGDCAQWQIDPLGCGQLGFVNGYLSQTDVAQLVWSIPTDGGDPQIDLPIGGTSHDGDQSFDLCVKSQGIQGLGSNGATQTALDLRSLNQLARQKIEPSMHIEVPWCRWFGGPVHLDADTGHQATEFCTFRPLHGEPISVVGDWVVGENSHSEIHEARFIAAILPDPAGPGPCTAQMCALDQSNCLVKGSAPDCSDPTTPGCTNKDTWHIMTNGFFAKDTAQQDELDIIIPVPPPTFPKTPMTTLSFSLPSMSPFLGTGSNVPGGCSQLGSTPGIACDPVAGTCSIRLGRGSAPLSDRDCFADHVCPCTNRHEPISSDIGVAPVCFGQTGSPPMPVDEYANAAGFDWCNASSQSHINFAADLRIDWDDPPDAWKCDCECDDPSTPGATIVAPVYGCAEINLHDDEPDDRVTACSQACGGLINEGSPANRIGVCRPPSFVPEAFLVGANACRDPAPLNRVSTATDYKVALTHDASTVTVGKLDSNGHLSDTLTTKAAGFVNFSVSGPPGSQVIELANARPILDDVSGSGPFGSNQVDLTGVQALLLNRSQALEQPDGGFVIPTMKVKIAAQGFTNGIFGDSVFNNEGEFTVALDLAQQHLALDGAGSDGQGHGLTFHLEGTIVNHPPVADPGPPAIVECNSPTGTPVILDGRASSDPDPRNTISHYQWFEGDAGVSNQGLVTVPASLGTHSYELHVYDQDLASAMHSKQVKVRDTMPPQLAVVPAPACLWPPNHDFALFTLGQELQYTVTDSCDAHPFVWIDSVVSDEAANATGSGATTPDVIFGTESACVRSERTGSGAGRSYSVTVKARDSSCNTTTQVVRVLVPHDQSGHPGCSRATGLDAIDARCSAGAAVPVCVPPPP